MRIEKLDNQISLVLFDVDGVMTDGTIYMSESGEVIKAFNVKDGLAIELLRSHNIKTGVISGKSSPALSKRCEQLGFDVVITGCKNKLPRLYKLSDELDIALENIAFCGDDVLDLPIFSVVGLSVAPPDAHQLVLERADWVSNLPGGKGMVREFVDDLLQLQTGGNLSEIYVPLMNKISKDDVQTLEQ
ncbi:HAD hydrolase family protein [Photobacterium halotolerans]|uniref:KdsC family phosphatase n=1 Tax=Photobacterium halotolerans TaxID=265726 RepID=UPI001372BEEC|nr:HAD-IIIA family hydrolase [Photobacterium halotolerans]NAX48084.1 HAD hydrolase family protein [Photobacterium halotolerans]